MRLATTLAALLTALTTIECCGDHAAAHGPRVSHTLLSSTQQRRRPHVSPPATRHEFPAGGLPPPQWLVQYSTCSMLVPRTRARLGESLKVPGTGNWIKAFRRRRRRRSRSGVSVEQVHTYYCCYSMPPRCCPGYSASNPSDPSGQWPPPTSGSVQPTSWPAASRARSIIVRGTSAGAEERNKTVVASVAASHHVHSNVRRATSVRLGDDLQGLSTW